MRFSRDNHNISRVVDYYLYLPFGLGVLFIYGEPVRHPALAGRWSWTLLGRTFGWFA